MKILTTAAFDKDYARLPARIQAQVDKQLAFLLADPGHASLNFKKMQGRPGIWESRVSHGYRLTLERDGDTLILRRIGPHDILKFP